MKKKVIKSLLFVVGVASIFTSGVIAAKLTAKDVGFTASNEEWKVDNVEDAVNDLYASYNTVFETSLRTESHSKNVGVTNFNLQSGSFKRYRYFKITKKTPNENVDKYNIYGWSVVEDSAIILNLNEEYDINEINNLWIVISSKTEGLEANGYTTVLFYNK